MFKRSKKSSISLWLILFLLIQMLSPGFIVTTSYAADFEPLSISLTVNKSTVKTGEGFVYSVSFSVRDLEKGYDNVKIKTTLPEEVEYFSYAQNNQVKSITQNGQEIEISVANDESGSALKAGSTGLLEINVGIKDGSMCTGKKITNSFSIEADGTGPFTSNSVDVDVETITASESWKITKRALGSDHMPGSDVTYEVKLEEDSSSIGRVGIKDVVIVDTLPAEGTLVNPELYDGLNGAGLYEVNPDSSQQIAWNVGAVEVGNTPTYQYTLNFPTVNEGDIVTNTARVTGSKKCDDTDTIDKQDSASVTFVGPKPPTSGGIGFYKTRSHTYRYVGQIQTYTIGNIRNTGNVSVENFVVEDNNLPTELDYKNIYLPNGSYTFEYEINNSNVWITKTVTPGTTFDVSTLGLGSNYLTGIRFDFGNIEAGFEAGQIKIVGTVINPSSDGNTVSHGTSVSNTASLTFEYGGTPTNLTDTASFTVNEEKPWIDPTISHNKGISYLPEDTVKFDLTVSNLSGATGPLKNPIIYNLLPEKFDYENATVVGEWESNAEIPSPSTFDVVPNFNGTGRTLLKWTWISYQMPIGETIDISYDTTIQEYTPPSNTGASYDNELFITSNDHLVAGFWWGTCTGFDEWNTDKVTIEDPGIYGYNFDGDDGKIEYLVKASTEVIVNEIAAVLTTKWNKGALDDEYQKFPDAGETVEGATADYKLEIFNEGNTNIKKVEILDILPYIGDTAVLTSQDRKSAWRPNLLSEVSTSNLGVSSADVKTYYSISSDKQFINFDYNKNDTTYWMDSIPENFDITSIQSIYFDITNINGGSGLEPGETLTLEWKMRAPVGAPKDIIAWNSIGVKATTINDTSLNAAEPNKVGFKIVEDNNGQIGNFVWFDSNGNGIQDDGHDNQEAGINGIKVKLYRDDDNGGDIDSNELIDETLTADDHNGNPGYYLFPNLKTFNFDYYVVFEIPSYYTVTDKDINHDSTNSIKDDSSSQDTSNDSDGYFGTTYFRSDKIELSYNEKHHDIDLGLIKSIDNASMNVTKEAISAVDKDGDAIGSLDPGEVRGGERPVNKDETITYLISVENDGSVPLNNVRIHDVVEDGSQSGFSFTKVGFDKDNLIDFTDHPSITSSNNAGATPEMVIDRIEVGDIFYLQGKYTIQSDDVNGTSLKNTVKAWSNETHSDAGEVPVTDDSLVDIADISLTKTSDVTEVEPGVSGKDTITYTISVTNNGSIALNNIRVIDDKIEAFTNIGGNLSLDSGDVLIATLNPGETQDVKGTYTAKEADLPNKIVNTASATHSSDIRYTVEDTNEVDTKDLIVTKEATDSDKIVKVGDTITYNITLTNNGSIDLRNVRITEEILTSSKNGGVDQNLINNITGSIPNPLGVGNSATVYLQYDVSQDDINDTSTQKIINTVKATSDDTTPEETDTETVDIADVKVEKVEKNPQGPYGVGEDITYEIKVTNTGTIDLSNILVRDRIYNKSAGNSYTQISSYTISSLAKGTSDTREIVYTLTENDLTKLGSNSLKNRARVTIPVVSKTVEKDVNVETKGIKLTKTGVKDVGDGDGILEADETITYTFTIKNIGSVALNNVTLTDNNFDTDAASIKDIGTIDAGETVIKNYVYTVLDTDLPGPIKNTATAVGDPNPDNGQVSDDDTHYIGDPKIEIQKYVYYGHDNGAQSQAAIDSKWDEVKGLKGTPVTYVLEVTNIGDTHLNGINISDDKFTINHGVSTFLIDSLSDHSTFDISTNLAGYPTKEKLVFYYETTIDSDLGDDGKNVTNTATVTGNPSTSSGDDVPSGVNPSDDDTAKVIELHPSVKIDKEVQIGKYVQGYTPGEKAVGLNNQDVTYIFTVTNTGDTYLDTIEITDANLKNEADNAVTIADMTKISGSIPLAPGGSIGYYYDKTKINGDLTNTASVKANPSEDSGADIGTIAVDYRVEDDDTALVDEVLPSVKLEKTIVTTSDANAATVSDVVYRESDNTITYVFKVTNTGDTYLNDLALTDLDLGIDETDMILKSGSFPLSSGAAVEYRYTTSVVNSLLNKADVEANPTDSSGSDYPAIPNVTDDDTAEVVVVNPVIELDKTVALGHINDITQSHEEVQDYKNKNITYFFKVTNNGDTYLNNISLIDTTLNPSIDKDDMSLVSGSIPLAPKGELVYYYQTTVKDDLVNTATVEGNPCDVSGNDLVGILSNPTDTDTATVKILGTIGDYVWLDLDHDRFQDAEEKGIENVRVYLKDTGQTVIESVYTDRDGYYLFDDLVSDDYIVEVDVATLTPDGLVATYDFDGNNNSITDVTLSNGDNITNVDFGYVHSGVIGDTVWYDLDENGSINGSEKGIKDVKVTLKDGIGTEITSTTTDINGEYLFEYLPAGTYTVEVEMPVGLELVSETDGTLDNEHTVNISAGETNLDLDFGYNHTGQIGDTIWYDLNENGSIDVEENGIANVTVELYKDDTKIAVKATDANGYYEFIKLESGSYKVKVIEPQGVNQVYDPDGTIDNESSVNLSAGQIVDTKDFGYNHAASLGDYVWFDENGDGVQDSNESGIGGVTVVLKDGSESILKTTKTDGNGIYGFKKLPEGDYIVEVQTSSLPAGLNTTYDLDGNLDNKASAALNPGDTKLDLDFGYVGAGIIGDTIWQDDNDNGVLDSGENGIANVTVTLRDSHGVETTATTDTNGIYMFDRLVPGMYTIIVDEDTLPTEMIVTYNNDDEKNNVTTVDLQAYQSNLNADFGYRLPIPHMKIEKIADVDTIGMNGTINYIITVTNDGETVLNNVYMVDEFLSFNENIGSLTVGESVYRPLKYKTQQGDVPGPIVNVAKAYSDETTEISDTVSVDINTNPYLKIEKTGPTGYVEIGDEITYNIVVTNIGDIDLHNVRLIDEMLSIDEGLGTLTVSDSVYRTKIYKVLEKDAPGPLINTAKATSDETSEVEDSWENEIKTNPMLSIKKLGPLGNVYIGERIEYTLILKNEGDIKLHDIRLEDELADFDMLISELEAGQTVTESVYYTVKEKDAPVLKNTATAKSDETGTVESNEWKVVVQINPNLRLTKTGPTGPVKVGEEIQYLLSIENIGDTVLESVYVEDSMLGFSDTIDNLKVGDSIELNPDIYTVTEEDYWSGLITNTADAYFTVSETVYGSVYGSVYKSEKVYATWTIPTIGADFDLRIDKSVDKSSAKIGEVLNYTIEVTNKSTVALKNVQVKDDLIGLNETISTLDVNEVKTFKGTYTIKTTDEAKEKITNTATATSGDITVSDDVETKIIKEGLNIVKTVDRSSAKVGDTLTYTIKVINNGNVALNDVHIEDDLIGLDETITSLGVNEEKEYTGTYIVTNADENTGKVTNIATATSGDIIVSDGVETEVKKDNPDNGGSDPDPDPEPVDPEPQPEPEQPQEPVEPVVPVDPEQPEPEVPTDEPTDDSLGDIDIDDDGNATYTPPEDVDVVDIVEEPTNGTVEIDEEGNVKYTPSNGYKGPDKFKLKIKDEDGNELIIEIEIPEEDIPQGTINVLPQTGEGRPYAYYLFGFALLLLGLYMNLENLLKKLSAKV